jgi:hypothetical protein
MAGAIKHMERSHRATAAKRNSGTFNHFHRNAYAVSVVRQQKKMTFGQHLKSMLKRAAGKES